MLCPSGQGGRGTRDGAGSGTPLTLCFNHREVLWSDPTIWALITGDDGVGGEYGTARKIPLPPAWSSLPRNEHSGSLTSRLLISGNPEHPVSRVGVLTFFCSPWAGWRREEPDVEPLEVRYYPTERRRCCAAPICDNQLKT